MKKIYKIHILFLLFFTGMLFFPVNFLHADSERRCCLAPKSLNPSNLEMALKELDLWKQNNENRLKTIRTDKILQTDLHTKARLIFLKHKIQEYPLSDRFTFALKVLEGVDPFALHTLEEIQKWSELDEHSQYFYEKGELTPEGYHQFDLLFQNKYQFMNKEEATSLDAFNSHVNLTLSLDSFVFNFGKGEKELLELCWLNKQFFNELKNPGDGKIPTIAAISDIHGGARRLIPLIAYTLGLREYKNLFTVKDLKKALEQNNIKPQEKYIRIVAMSDIPDRGKYPVESHRLVEYLTSELHIGKFIVGNHDLWRMMGVLGVHELEQFSGWFEKGEFKGPAEEASNHPAYWAHEAVYHAAWGSNEVDELNQERINALIDSYNKKYKLKGEDALAPIDILDYREKFLEPEVKRLKKINSDIAKGRREGKKQDVPGIMEGTLKFLDEQITDRNKKMIALNESRGTHFPELTFYPLNLEDYSKDKEVLEHAYWVGRHFRLFYIDPFGNLHWHSILPVKETLDENKNPIIEDFDVSYKGRKGLKALEAMQNNVQKFFSQYSRQKFIGLMQNPQESKKLREIMWQEIGDILSIVDAWYSDTKKTAKPESIQKFIDYGGHKALPSITGGTDSFKQRKIRAGLFMGHNDLEKYRDKKMDWIVFKGDMNNFVVQTDGSMSEGYENLGRICLQGTMPDGTIRGATNFGYEKPDPNTNEEKSKEIKDITYQNLYGSMDKDGKVTPPPLLKQIQDTQLKFWMWNQVNTNTAYISELLGSLLQNAAGDSRKKEFYNFLMEKFSETKNVLHALSIKSENDFRKAA